MSENTDTGLLREIDEELRQEHYSKLWSRFGSYIIASAVLLVVGVAGYKMWQAYNISTRSDLTERFSKATTIELDGDLTKAQEAYSLLIKDGSAGFSMLSRFRFAANLAKLGKQGEAAIEYRRLASDRSVKKQYRDLATILSVMNELDTIDPSDILAYLSPLTADNNRWRFSARELSALAAIRAGDNTKANEYFNQLILDPETPTNVRTRAQELRAATDTP